MNDPARPVSLHDCDREPIHVPGSIQSHGSLLALDDAGRVVVWSADFDDAVRASASTPVTLATLLGAADAARLAPSIEAEERRPIRPVPLTESARQALVHRNEQGLTLVELEALALDDADLAAVLRLTQETTQRLGRLDTPEATYEALAGAVRRLTGFDRVMVYRFAEDWRGRVVAEARDDAADSYLGFHFPASDVPAQARALYERNPLRLIADVASEPVPLHGGTADTEAGALDLSDAVLRSVSPIHVQYLKNMRVGSSMSVSLLRDGKLWGLVACHHRTAKNVPFEVRQACELIGQFASNHVSMQEQLLHVQHASDVRAVLRSLATHLLPDIDGGVNVEARLDELSQVAACDALLVVTPARTTLRGADGDSLAIAAWLDALPLQPGETPWSSNTLIKDAPLPVEPAMAGALVIRTATEVPVTVAWLRLDRVRKTRWAGDPNKPLVRDPDGVDRLHPRESFSAWVEESRGTAEPWSTHEIESVRELQTLILSPSVRAALALSAQAAALEQANRQLAASNEELERFAYVASHDLRAPLRAVQNIVEWLREDEGQRLSGQALEFLELLESRVRRMDRMMIDLLAYARAGRESSPVEAIEMNELVSDIADSISRPTGLDVVCEACDTVHGPRVPVFQIVLNLVSNAIKHHDLGRGTVRVAARHEGKALVLTVTDDGPGIAPEHRDRVFEMFTTLASRDDVEGSGIGLAMIRRYAKRWGGDVEIEDAVPRGTRFIVRLYPEGRDE